MYPQEVMFSIRTERIFKVQSALLFVKWKTTAAEHNVEND